MKMKEVTERTNLTERAVRLYIENGLVEPSFKESYSGRRNLEFSEDDVACLRKISVLRKAGFTISQIKQMQTEPEKCKELLTDLIKKTNERIETDKVIVSCLEPLLCLDTLDMVSMFMRAVMHSIHGERTKHTLYMLEKIMKKVDFYGVANLYDVNFILEHVTE